MVNQNQTEKAEDKNLNKDSVFEKVEYQGLYDFDKPFIVISEKAHVMSEFPDIVYMDNMKVTIRMDDGRIVIITGDKGIYNKSTYDCFFEGNDFTELGRYEYALVSLENHPPILGSKN